MLQPLCVRKDFPGNVTEDLLHKACKSEAGKSYTLSIKIRFGNLYYKQRKTINCQTIFLLEGDGTEKLAQVKIKANISRNL